MKKLCIICTGAILLAVSVLGIVHGIPASTAFVLYYQAKYGSASDNPRGIFRRCDRAFRLYPRNYYFAMFTARTAYCSSYDVDGDEAKQRLETASRWCKIGLKLNPYKRETRLVKARLLARDSVRDAIAYWEEYVDWHFWEPYNHSVLVELHARAGNFVKATESLKWVKGSEYYEKASRKLSLARQEEMLSQPPIQRSDIRSRRPEQQRHPDTAPGE